MRKDLKDMLSLNSYTENFEEVHKPELDEAIVELSAVFNAITNHKPFQKHLDVISAKLSDAFGLSFTLSDTKAEVAATLMSRLGHTVVADVTGKADAKAFNELVKTLTPRQLSENRTFADIKDPIGQFQKAVRTRQNEKAMVALMLSQQAKLLKSVQAKGFSVDRKNVYVTGGEDIHAVIGVNFKKLFIDEGLLEREVMAVILHEVGHNMTQLDNLVTVAQTDADMVNVLQTGADILNGLDVREKLQELEGVIHHIYRDDLAQYLSKEYIADDFVVKLGYEHEHKTVLDFISKYSGPEYMSNREILPLLGLALMSISFVALTMGLFMGLVYGLYVSAFTMILKQAKDYNYGTPKDRLENLRNSIIDKIRRRTKRTSKEEKQRLNILLDEIDAMLKTQQQTNILTDIADYYDGQKINYDVHKAVKRLINNRLQIV